MVRAALILSVVVLSMPALAQRQPSDGGTSVLTKGGEVVGTGALKVTQGVGDALNKEGETTGEKVGEGTAKLANGLFKGITKGLGVPPQANGTGAPTVSPGGVLVDSSLIFLGVAGAVATRKGDGVRVELQVQRSLSTALVLIAVGPAGRVIGRATRDSQRLIDGDALTFTFGPDVDLGQVVSYRLQ
ncbi:MAG: hypothetical protein U0228_39025 [Myxococcaceae bacterium]